MDAKISDRGDVVPRLVGGGRVRKAGVGKEVCAGRRRREVNDSYILCFIVRNFMNCHEGLSVGGKELEEGPGVGRRRQERCEGAGLPAERFPRIQADQKAISGRIPGHYK